MNTRTRSLLFAVAGLLVLAGALLYLSHWAVAHYLFAVGTAGVAVSYLTIPTKEMSFRVRRLHRFNMWASLLMIFSSGLMFAGRKEWVLALFIAALFQLYTAFVQPKS